MKNLVKLFVLLFFGAFAVAGMGFESVQCAQNSTVTYVRASHILVDTKEQADMIKSKIDNGVSFGAWLSNIRNVRQGKMAEIWAILARAIW